MVSPLLREGQHGRLPERPMGADCKSVGFAYDGSNPSPATSPGPSDRGFLVAGLRAVVQARQEPSNRPDFSVNAGSDTLIRLYAPLAQSAERLHGKEKVYGSIP